MILETLQLANNVMLDSVQATNNKQATKNFKDQIIALNSYTTQLEPLLNLLQALKDKNLTAGIISPSIIHAN